jgi:hypothetical protein
VKDNFFFRLLNGAFGTEACTSLERSATEHSLTRHRIRLLHNLLNVLVQIANKMGLQKNIYRQTDEWLMYWKGFGSIR